MKTSSLILAVLLASIACGQSLPPQVKDTPYAPSWNGVKFYAPSQNAVYDQMEALVAGTITTILDDIDSQDPNGNVMLYWPTSANSAEAPTTAFGRSLLNDANAAEHAAACDADAVLDARWFGSIDPTGVADSTAGLQAAIDAAEDANGATVIIPVGRYSISQLKLNNRVRVLGAGRAQSRWNLHGGCVELVADGTADPAILVGGQTDSDSVEGGYYFAEGITLENLYLTKGAGTGRGIVVDGSTTVLASRGPARDIVLRDVHVYDFNDHNVEFVGNCFDIRWDGGSSAGCDVTGIIATTAASYGSTSPSQLSLYDVYVYGNATGPQWALDGPFHVFGGGIAYGNGFLMRSRASLFGTHVEGVVLDGGIGLAIVGQYCRVVTDVVATYSIGIQIGDGTAAACRDYDLVTTISGADEGMLVTAGGDRAGCASLVFSACTLDVNDLRNDTDGVAGSVDVSVRLLTTAAPVSGAWMEGTFVRNEQPAAGEPFGWVCTAGGSPGTWEPVSRIGQEDHFSVILYDDGDWAAEETPIWQGPHDRAITITKVLATVGGSTAPALVYNIEERNWGNMGTPGTDVYTADETADMSGEEETTFANAGIAAKAHLVFTTGATPETGSVDWIQLTVYYK